MERHDDDLSRADYESMPSWAEQYKATPIGSDGIDPEIERAVKAVVDAK